MRTRKLPRLVRTEDLPSYFLSNGITYAAVGSLQLGFGKGNEQYQLYPYPGPADDETMAVFCEVHTENFFEVETGPHIGIGMRGPVKDDPHRGRGLAIGILASHMINPDDPENPVQLFKGCPAPPGGPSFFIEDFSKNDGIAPIADWQLSLGQLLPQLQANNIYRIDVHVSLGNVWAGVWEVIKRQSGDGVVERDYLFLGQVACSDEAPAYSGNPGLPCPESAPDHGRGNVFIASAFADPETKSWVDNIYIAHWKNQK